ncbi:MAG: halocyanin, partial [Euryarchaeota archaeon]|nr:halocyanin [Euryarchaeota archaeon]
MQRRAFLAVLGGSGLAGLSGCTAIADLTEDHDIAMSAHEFLPDSHTIEV